MTDDQDFQRIFHHADLLLVVDEWKGEQVASEPEFLVARSFDASTLPLYQALRTHQAESWHASGRRGEFSFLFADGVFEPVMAEIHRTNTCLYHHLFKDLEHYRDGTPAGEHWHAIMRSNPELARVWRKTLRDTLARYSGSWNCYFGAFSLG